MLSEDSELKIQFEFSGSSSERGKASDGEGLRIVELSQQNMNNLVFLFISVTCLQGHAGHAGKILSLKQGLR